MQQDFFDPPHVALMKEANSLRLSVAGALEKASKLEVLAKELCPHDSIKTNSEYFPGGYLDTDHTNYEEACSFCGLVLKRWREQGSSYG